MDEPKPHWKCTGYCGRIISDAEYQDECDAGSGSFCYCEYQSCDRVLNTMEETQEPLRAPRECDLFPG